MYMDRLISMYYWGSYCRLKKYYSFKTPDSISTLYIILNLIYVSYEPINKLLNLNAKLLLCTFLIKFK
jgi:hypothetical protein